MSLPPLFSPRNAAALRPAGRHLLSDGDLLWPVVDGIPYLRADGAARAPAVAALQAGDTNLARRILLTDRDRFAPGEPADPNALTDIHPGSPLNLREAMQRLGYGAVGDYFAHRWSSPTFLSGVFLLHRIARPGRAVVEVACGIGHFLRLLERHDYAVTGIDIVWSKLWLARHYLDVRGPLICADIEAANPLEADRDRTVFCHDAFYFFERKARALEHLRELRGPGGNLAVGHVHTRKDTHEAGFAWPLERYTQLTDSVLWGEGSQVQCLLKKRVAPAPARPEDGAVGWTEGRRCPAGHDLLRPNDRLQLNPLLARGEIRWPSGGWRAEYLADAAPMNGQSLPSQLHTDTVRQLTADPGLIHTLTDKEQTCLHRSRILLDLPQRW